MPIGARVAAGHDAGVESTIHEPDRGLAGVQLPENIGLEITIEITGHFLGYRAGIGYLPAGAWTAADPRLAQYAGAVHEPDNRLTVAVLPQDVGPAITVKIAGTFDLPAGARVGADLYLA